MRKITFNKNKYETICMAEPKLIFRIVRQYLEQQYGRKCEYKKDGYLFIKGDIPICLVSHVDVVLHSAYEFHYCEEERIVFSLSGADDDRNGVYSICEIVHKGYRPSVLLVDGEESGGLGTLEFIRDHKKFPTNIKFFIELDRQGHDDMVTYDYKNPAFDKAICRFGFKKQIGTFSDIVYLSPYYNRGAVNLSIGYSNEHTIGCHTYIRSMINTINKVCKILDNEYIFPVYEWDRKEYLKQKNDIEAYLQYDSKINAGRGRVYGHRYPLSGQYKEVEDYPLNPAYDDYLDEKEYIKAHRYGYDSFRYDF